MKTASILILLLTLTATAKTKSTKSDYQRPATVVSPAYKSNPLWRGARPLENLPRGAWWTIFKDPVLNGLQQRAAAESQQLRMAVARFDQARASARIARSNFFPVGSVSPAAFNQQTSSNAPSPVPLNGLRYEGWSFDVPVDLTWELDLWGRVRRQYESAVEQAAAEASAMQNALLSLHAEVAQNYFRLRALDAELATVRDGVDWRRQWVEVQKARVKTGTGNELELSQAETEHAAAQTELAALAGQRDQLENAIAILCAADASSFDIAPAQRSLPAAPTIPQGLPSDLLERRPDIAQAERLLSAACSRLGVAERAWFPSVKLIASGGLLSGEVSSLFDTESTKWNIGPSVSLPFFSGGKNKANLERARAQHDEALAAYRQTILVALGDVENQLSALDHLSTQADAQARTLTSAEKTLTLAKARHDAGGSPYLEVIEASRAALTVQRGTQQLAGQRLIATVALIKALGGGWHQSLPVIIPPQTTDPVAVPTGEKKPGLLKRLFAKKKTEG
jgi:outer membrane protein, multidrug efflux system